MHPPTLPLAPFLTVVLNPARKDLSYISVDKAGLMAAVLAALQTKIATNLMHHPVPSAVSVVSELVVLFPPEQAEMLKHHLPYQHGQIDGAVNMTKWKTYETSFKGIAVHATEIRRAKLCARAAEASGEIPATQTEHAGLIVAGIAAIVEGHTKRVCDEAVRMYGNPDSYAFKPTEGNLAALTAARAEAAAALAAAGKVARAAEVALHEEHKRLALEALTPDALGPIPPGLHDVIVARLKASAPSIHMLVH